MLLSVTPGAPDSPEALGALWEKFSTLTTAQKEVLNSPELAQYIETLAEKISLSDPQVETFARTIRGFYFGDFTLDDAAARITQALQQSDTSVGVELMTEIQNLTIAPYVEDVDEEEADVSPAAPASEQLTLVAGVERYPQVLSQLVTSKRIVSKPFPSPLSPTVKNWIAVYEKVAGIAKHTTIERGEFLYRSQACRGLSEIDRIKLSQLLGARDQGDLLKFSVEKGGIIWQKKELPPVPQTQTPSPAPTPASGRSSTTQDGKFHITRTANDAAPQPDVTGRDKFRNAYSENLNKAHEARLARPLGSNDGPAPAPQQGAPRDQGARTPLGSAHAQTLPTAQNQRQTFSQGAPTPVQQVAQSAPNATPNTQGLHTNQMSPDQRMPRGIEGVTQDASLQNFTGQPQRSQMPQKPQTPPASATRPQMPAAPAQPAPQSAVNFSSGQILPVEKASQATHPRPAASPFHIDPMGRL